MISVELYSLLIMPLKPISSVDLFMRKVIIMLIQGDRKDQTKIASSKAFLVWIQVIFFFIHLWYSIPFFTFVVWGSWSRWIYLMRDNDDDVVSRWLVIRIRARLVRMSLMKLISLLLPLLLLWDNHCIIFIF